MYFSDFNRMGIGSPMQGTWQQPWSAHPSYQPLFMPTTGSWSPWAQWMTPEWAPATAQWHTIHQKLDLLGQQIAFLNDLVRRSVSEQIAHGFQPNGVPAYMEGSYGSPAGGIYNRQPHGFSGEFCPVRVRESDSHIFWDLCLPSLVMSDVDVEVSGNRVICRTRVPMSPANRWWHQGMPVRGLELFEMPDGRVEFNWVVPVAFQAREVEATWREGWICVCIPKAESGMQRQSVKLTKDAQNGRKNSGGHELNA